MKKFIRLLEYIYYRMYIRNKKKWGQDSFENNDALIQLAFLLIPNVLTLHTPVILFYGIMESKVIYLISVTILLVGISYYFKKGNRRQKIIERYEVESKEEHKRRGYWMWGYIIFSFAILFLTIYFLLWLKVFQ